MTEISHNGIYTVAEAALIPIADVMSKMPAGVSPRYVRETMTRLGLTRKIGRAYHTTPEEVAQYLDVLKQEGLCREKTARQGRTSSRISGARRGMRVATSPSVSAVVSPERELKEALARIAGPKRKHRNSAMT